MEDLWNSDINRYPENEYVLYEQTNVQDSDRVDMANDRYMHFFLSFHNKLINRTNLCLLTSLSIYQLSL